MKAVLIILALLTALPSICFADLATLEKKLLSRDRQGVHDELQQILHDDSGTFYKVLDMYEPILGMFETYEKLQTATGLTEQRLFEKFHEYSRVLPSQIPFSQELVDSINGVRGKVNERIKRRNEEARLAAEQRKIAQEERERARAAELEAIRTEREEQRRKEEEAQKKAQEAQKKAQEAQEAQLAEQEKQRVYNEKVTAAQELVCSEPEYIKQSLICQVCGSVEGKRQLREGLKNYQSYERTFGVINLTARKNAVDLDIEYDSQIAEGKVEYKSKFKKAFPMSACKNFSNDICQSKLNAIEKRLVEKYLATTK